jgi:ATP-dependent Clp protease, protease subunit
MAVTAVTPTHPNAYVVFNALINPPSARALLTATTEVAERGQRVVLCLGSPGGGVSAALMLYNALRALPIQLVTHNVGEVGSAANVIFLAGAERVASPNSTFMFHRPTYTADAGEEFDVKALRRTATALTTDEKRVRTLIEERTTLTGAQINHLKRNSKTVDAEYALTSGIVDQIEELQIPAGSPVITVQV